MPDIKLPDFEFASIEPTSIVDSEQQVNVPNEGTTVNTNVAAPEENEDTYYEEDGSEDNSPSIEEDEENSDTETEADVDPGVETDVRYKSLAEFYRDEGLLNFEGEFKGGADEFAEILKTQREEDAANAAMNLISAVPEYAQSLMEFMITSGEKLTKEKITAFFDLVEQGDIVPEEFDEETAESFLLERYTRTLKSQDKAKKYVDMLKFDGELLEVAAKEAEEELKVSKQAQRERIEQEKVEAEALKAKAAEYQQKLIKQAEALPWKKEIKQQAVDFIYNQGLKQATQEVVNHPAALLKLSNYLRYFDPEKGDIDETAYQKQMFSKAARQLKNDIESRFLKSDAMSAGRQERQRGSDKNVKFEFAD